MKPKVIVFDAYGTLFNVNALDHLLEKNFGGQSLELSAIWRRKQLEYTWLRTLMDRYIPFSIVTLDALRYGCNYLNLKLTKNIETQLIKEYLNLSAYPEVKDILEDLSGAYQLAILSNADPEMLSGAVTYNQLDNLFAHVLSADIVRLYKPRQEVYQMACTAFSCLPPEILFISSNTWDVVGAKSFGFQVAWLNRSQTVMEHLDLSEDVILSGLIELGSWLKD